MRSFTPSASGPDTGSVTGPRPRRWMALGALLVLAVAGGFDGGRAAAEGDNTIESSNPSAGEVVTVAPTQIQLRFAKPVGGAEAVARMGLSLSCEGKLTNLGSPQLAADGVTVSAALTQIPDNGNCTVSWSLPDGSSGSFQFESQAQATTTTSSTVPTGDTVPPAPTEGTVSEPRLGGPIGLMRWIVFIAVSAMFGACMFIKTSWPEGVEYDITMRYMRLATVLGVIATYLLVVFMNGRASGGDLGASFLFTSWGPLLESNEGRAVVVRLVGVIGLGIFCWIPERLYNPDITVWLALALATPMLSYGFDRASGRAVAFGVVLAIVHMVASSWWVGGILMVWRVVLHGPGEADLVHALRGWYRMANLLAVVAIFSGAAQAYRLDNLSLINSGHGRLVLFKSLIVGALLFVGAAVRHYVLHGMRRGDSLNQRTVLRLKRPVGLELSLSVAILAASSWLMAMRPPYVLLPQRGPVAQYAIVQEMSGDDDFRVRVSITPGNVGPNRILVELLGPKRVQNLTVTLVPSNPAFSGYTIYVPITRPGAALAAEDAGLALKAPGQWSIEVSGVTTVGELAPLKGSFIIADGVTVTTLPRQDQPGTANSTTTVPGTTTTVPGTETTTTTVAGG